MNFFTNHFFLFTEYFALPTKHNSIILQQNSAQRIISGIRHCQIAATTLLHELPDKDNPLKTSRETCFQRLNYFGVFTPVVYCRCSTILPVFRMIQIHPLAERFGGVNFCLRSTCCNVGFSLLPKRGEIALRFGRKNKKLCFSFCSELNLL